MNKLTMLLFLCIVPIILILVIVYSKDKNKESLPLLIRLFVLGIAACFLTLFISKNMSYIFPFMQKSFSEKDFLSKILYAFIGVALVEEFSKWIFVFWQGYTSKRFDEIYDIIVYSVFVSLGFAFYENFLYVFNYGTVKTALLRAILSIPAHACTAIFMGYYFCIAKQFKLKNRKSSERYNLILSLMVPTLLHGIFDFCLMIGYVWFLVIFYIFITILYINSIRKIKGVSKYNQAVIHKSKYCPNCGRLLNNSVCQYCAHIEEKEK